MIKIYVPLDTTSVSLGADEVVEEITQIAAQNNHDIQIIRNGSWGLFWLETLVEVEVKGERVAYGPVTENDVAGLFEADFLTGGEHPLRVGDITKVPYLAKQTRLCFKRVGLVDPMNIDDYIKHGGFTALKKAFSMSSADLIKEMEHSGLRGRGGAAFPSYLKLQATKDTPDDEKFVVCNFDEGDSGTFSDRMMGEGDPFMILEGMFLTALAVGASEGYIYLRSEYPIARKVLNNAINLAKKTGWLGKNIQNSGKDFDIHLRVGAGSYVCGEETALLNSLEGKRGTVRVKPPFPVHKGLFGKPTALFNVISLVSMVPIIEDGGKAYGKLGYDRSRGTCPFQLSGNIKYGGLVELPFGITVRDIIDDFGGGLEFPFDGGRDIKLVQIGGPLGYHMSKDDLDNPLDYEHFKTLGGHIGHGGIIVMGYDASAKELAHFAFDFCALESCGTCTPCRIGSRRGAEMMEQVISGKAVNENIILIKELCDTLTQTSLCALGGITAVPVLSLIKNFPNEFEDRYNKYVRR